MPLLSLILLSGCSPDYVKPTAGKTIVAFGDSLTEGIGAGDGLNYVETLSSRLDEEVINAGVSGDTTTEALVRLKSDVLDADPRLVIVLLGGNDALQTVKPDTTFRNLEEIIDTILDSGAGVILVGVRGGIHNREYKRRFEEIATARDIPYIEDALKGLFGKREFMADRIHPNSAGYTKLANRIEPVVREILE